MSGLFPFHSEVVSDWLDAQNLPAAIRRMAEALWCGHAIMHRLPPQSMDTPHVGCNDRVICHVCVKHLAAIVLDQEHRVAHAARHAVDCEYCARGVPLSGSSPTMHDTGAALAPCTVLEIEAG